MRTYLLPLLLTIILESIVMILYLKVHHDHRWYTLADLLLINCFTNPVLNVIIQVYCLPLRWILAGECLVTVTEMLLHKMLKFGSMKECLRISLLTNIFSYMMGVIIYAYLF